jgi:NMD protein affecting ribosome stability and mRNA decay
MSKTRSAKPRPKKQAAKSAAPARKAVVPTKQRATRAKAEIAEEEDVEDYPPGSVMCRSCGKRPGRPTAILGQMTQAELCAQCTALRKERIRLNRAAARGLRSSRLF